MEQSFRESRFIKRRTLIQHFGLAGGSFIFVVVANDTKSKSRDTTILHLLACTVGALVQR